MMHQSYGIVGCSIFRQCSYLRTPKCFLASSWARTVMLKDECMGAFETVYSVSHRRQVYAVQVRITFSEKVLMRGDLSYQAKNV